MLHKISKSMAHFFVVQNVSKPEYEAVYAYGAEILLSTEPKQFSHHLFSY